MMRFPAYDRSPRTGPCSIAVACGGSCAVPTPVTAPICAACIGAYAVIGAGGIAGAVACFNYL